MAGVHNELQRYIGLLAAYQKALGEKSERFVGLERGGETLTPVLNLWSLPEWAHLRGEQLLEGFGTQGAIVGERAHVGLRNPVGSRRIVVVELMIVAAVAAVATGRISRSTSGLGTEAQGTSRDTRIFPIVGSTGIARVVSHTQAGVLGTTGTLYTVNTTQDRELRVPYVIAPGTTIFWTGNTDNVGFSVTFIWRERAALPGELE